MVTMIIRLAAAFIVGLASHLLHRPTRKLGPRVGSLTRYATGILIFIPMSILVKHGLGKKDNTTLSDVERDLAAGLLTAGAQGTGVFLGYILDSHEPEE